MDRLCGSGWHAEGADRRLERRLGPHRGGLEQRTVVRTEDREQRTKIGKRRKRPQVPQRTPPKPPKIPQNPPKDVTLVDANRQARTDPNTSSRPIILFRPLRKCPQSHAIFQSGVPMFASRCSVSRPRGVNRPSGENGERPVLAEIILHAADDHGPTGAAARRE